MARRQTAKSRYPSRYAPGKYVTALQYILEIICENKAKKENKQLILYFWKDKEWQTYYQKQLRICSKLLQKYGELSIINVIKKRSIWFLGKEWIENLIAAENDKIKKIYDQSISIKTYENNQDSLGRKPQESTLNKLKKIDD